MINWRDYESTPTHDLIELIKLKDHEIHLETAKAAFRAFYFRFFNSVAKKAVIVSRKNGYDQDFALEVAERTFNKSWKYPSFQINKMKVSDPDKGVELYLSKIAQNCFYDLVNERTGISSSPYDGNEEIIYEIPYSVEYVKLNPEKFQIINKVLSTFDDKHKIIYLTYLMHEHKGYKLPRKLLAQLRDKLNLSQDTIRFYRYEVLQKIDEYTSIWPKN